MKTFLPILISILFMLPSSAEAQFCCCPICPLQGASNVCVADIGGCITSCVVACGAGVGDFPSGTADCAGTACSTLPIELASFNAKVISERILLSWTTESESNNAGFEVQRISGTTWIWETIGYVEGNGNSLSRVNYSYEDNSAPRGTNYYRLYQVDLDGSSRATDIKTATLDADETITLWPTVAKDQLVFRLNDTRVQYAKYEVLIFNMMGQLMKKDSFIEEGLVMDISGFPLGNYVANINSNGTTNTYRFMKVE